MNHEMLNQLARAVEADDVASVLPLLEQSADAARPFADGPCPPAVRVLERLRSAAMADLFLRHTITVEQVSRWWAPGFGLQHMDPVVAEHLVARGATLTPHAAAALGLVGRLRDLLDRQPGLVRALGGDGARPLHFARDVETARLLVERGAEVDARDDDHDSTPAQWRIGDAPEVARFLIERGARPDIFMAAAWGELEWAARLIRENPVCVTWRIGHNSGPFPGIGFRGRGGTIYQWTLGFNQSPHEVAWARGHREFFEFLWRQTPPRHQLLVACMRADRARAEALIARAPELIGTLDAEDRALLAKSCWETNLNREAVRLMLDLGFPIDAPENNHGYLPLHNAAWCGDAELVELLLRRGHPVDRRDPTHHGTALGWAIHSCVEAQRHPEGDFPRVVRVLLEAGTALDAGQFPTGHAGIDAVIETYRAGRP